MIEFGDLRADLPSYENSGALVVDNVLPLAKGYKSLAGFQALSGTGLSNPAVGLFTSFSATGSTNYAGDATKLYQMDSSLVFQDKSKSGGYNNSTTENARDFWAFTQFGSNIIATNFADNIGAFAPKSVASYGNMIFFLAQDGFYKLTGGQQLAPIGNGKIDNFFYDDLSSNVDAISSAVDPNNSVVVWSYRGSGATGTSLINNKLIIYNYSVDKWSTGSDLDLEFISTASQEAFTTLESLDVLGNLDNLPKSLDSYFYDEGIVGLAGFNSQNKFGKFIATSLNATVDTTEFEGSQGRRSTLTSCRPIVDGTTNTTVTVSPIVRSSQLNDVSVGSSVATRDNGVCPLRSTGRYHRVRVSVSGNFNTMSGVDVEATPEGKR